MEVVNMSSTIAKFCNTLKFRKSDPIEYRKRELAEYKDLVKLIEDLGEEDHSSDRDLHLEITLHSGKKIETEPGYTLTEARFHDRFAQVQYSEYGRIDLGYKEIKSVELIIEH